MRRIIPATLMVVAFILNPIMTEAQSKEEGIRVFKEALQLRRTAQTPEDLKRAVAKYEKALVIFEHCRHKPAIGRVHNNLGNVYKDLARYDTAMAHYKRSLEICRELKDRNGEARSLNNLGIAYKHQAQYDEAATCFEKALAIRREVKDRQGEGKTLNDLGSLHRHRGQYGEAVPYHEKALAIFEELKDKRGEASTLNNLGNVFTNWGRYDKAMSYYNKSLAFFRDLREKKSEAKLLNNLGEVFRLRGQYDKAVSFYEQSLAIKEDLKDRRGQGQTLNNLGIVYKNWGQYDKAVSYYEQSLAARREVKDRRGEGGSLNNLGILYKNWGQYDKAVSYLDQSLAIFRALEYRWAEGQALNNLGAVQAHRGNCKEALRLFRQALAIWQEIRIPAGRSKNLIAHLYMDQGDFKGAEPFVKEAGFSSTRGRFHLLQGRYGKATAEYEKLLKSAEKNRNADRLFIAYTGLGLSYEGKGDLPTAAEYFKKAVAFTEELRTNLTADQRERFFDVRIQGFLRTVPYEGLARVLMRMRKPRKAMEGSEYSKARTFAETISKQAEGRVFDIPVDVLENDQRITDQLAALKMQRQKAYEKYNKLTIEALDPQINELERKLQAHIKTLRDKYPLFAATKYPKPMALSQTALKDKEWTLSYDITDSGVLIYLTKGKELVEAIFKPIARKELDEMVRTFRKPMEVSEADFTKKLKSFDFSTGKKLSDLLLSDALPFLPEGSPVIVIPDDSLGILPFEMLVLNDSGKISTGKEFPEVSGAALFGDRNPISYYQSITALTLARTLSKAKKSGSRGMVMADPVFDPKDDRLANVTQQRRIVLMKSMPDKLMSIKNEMGLTFLRLPLTGELARRVKALEPEKTDLFVGMEASKPVLLAKPLTQYGSMVFATHGYFGKDLPGIQEPVLILTLPDQPTGQDGFLRMSEVMGLKLNADVVALTACQTGLGRRLTGEGTMGMGRAFQYAGAKAVLMSLWSVTEQSSVQLVESFFERLKEGKAKLAALRLARKKIRESGYNHPFFWAGFILAGEVD